MKSWKTILALALCLSLAAAGAAVAKKHEKSAKVMAYGDGEKEMKVEVTETDGKAHVKVWEIKDGDEVLVEEFDSDADDDRVLKLDGERVIVIRGGLGDEWTAKIDDGHVMFHDDDDAHWVVAGDGEHLSWFDADGAWLGVSLSDLDEERAEYFERDEGALVTEIHEDSPAAKAGFKIFDIITRIGDADVKDADDAVAAVREREPGDEVEVTVVRKGKKKTLKAELAEREGFAYAFGDEAPHALLRRFHEGDGMRNVFRLHGDGLTGLKGLHEDEIENLRADIEELRAMLEELKADKD